MSLHIKKRLIRKRSFLLIELLLSLALIALCFFPLIKPHAAMRKVDYRHLEEIQLEQIAQTAFCEIKEILYQTTQHPWENLPNLKNISLQRSFTLWMGKENQKEIHCEYSTLVLDRIKKKSEKKVGLLLKISMHFSPTMTDKIYERTLYLEKV